MRKFVALVLLAVIAPFLIGCGAGSGSNGAGGGSNQGSVFIVGEDAPLPSVVSFSITIKSITLNNGSATVPALSTPTTFGRLMGLRSLLAFNSIPAGTYSSATFTLANPVITYIDMPTPASHTIAGSLTNATVTVAFPPGNPLVVSSNQMGGLHMDFNLHKSLAVDGSGNITGKVAPVIDIMAVSASDQLGKVTEFVGSVLSVGSSSFTVQGPYGFQEVIAADAQTKYSGTYTLASIPTNAIVAVQGVMQADGSILASDVDIITTDQAFISGRILAVNAGIVTMFVSEELPNMSPTIPVDSVYTVDLTSVPSSNYDICFFNNLYTQSVFSEATLAVGQRIFVSGTFQSGTFTPDLVSLRIQGVWGSLVSGSVAINNPPNQGTFNLQNDYLMSYAYGGPGMAFPVNTFNFTTFANVNGLSGLQAAGSTNVVAVGLVFQGTSGPVVDAGWVAVTP
jgi:Domain of unknown function (DUF5666)